MKIVWRSQGNCFKKRTERQWSESSSRKKRWLGQEWKKKRQSDVAVRCTEASAGLASRSWLCLPGEEGQKLEKDIQ